MFSTLDEFLTAAQPFADLFSAWATRYAPDASADHLCFKCASADEFEQLRTILEKDAGFVYQSVISARRIAIVKFPRPIPTALGDIWFLELSDQKPDGSQVSGFDHVEIYPKSGGMESLGELLESKGMKLEKIVRPHHTTIDGFIEASFKVRLEPEALVSKIIREEMK
jgi:predicted metalloenzyme YecM